MEEVWLTQTDVGFNKLFDSWAEGAEIALQEPGAALGLGLKLRRHDGVWRASWTMMRGEEVEEWTNLGRLRGTREQGVLQLNILHQLSPTCCTLSIPEQTPPTHTLPTVKRRMRVPSVVRLEQRSFSVVSSVETFTVSRTVGTSWFSCISAEKVGSFYTLGCPDRGGRREGRREGRTVLWAIVCVDLLFPAYLRHTVSQAACLSLASSGT